jgi:predicted nuclease of predicted toxin-antitoxin system
MRFLADESCDFAAVRALRDSGHDVLAVAEVARGAIDSTVVELAKQERRILLTEDKDFGWLVYAAGAGTMGVVLIRFPARLRRTLGEAIVFAVHELGERLAGAFAVVEPGRVRVGSQPPRP